MLKECASEWVEKAYLNPRKANRRNSLWPSVKWQYVLVHVVDKHPEELREIGNHGVKLVPLEKVLEEVCPPERPPFTASVGEDWGDLTDFYGGTHQLLLTDEPADEDQIEDDEQIQSDRTKSKCSLLWVRVVSPFSAHCRHHLEPGSDSTKGKAKQRLAVTMSGEFAIS